MATVGDLILASLRVIGELAEGETPTANTAQDALEAFNQMVESWSIERLAVYRLQDQVVTWPSSVASRTLGPTGDLVGLRPSLLDTSTYFVDPANGLSFPLQIVNREQYNSIALKTVTSTYPQVIWADMGVPDITLTVWPVPTVPVQLHVVSMFELSQPATLATEVAYPPGYRRALKYNLGLEIASEFGIEPSAQVRRLAMTSKRNIKRINGPDDLLNMPVLMPTARNRYNIYSNQPQ